MEAPNFGSSIPVESVQEIVRRDPLSIPERYIRNSIDKPIDATLSSEIPVIDLSLLSGEQLKELERFDVACKDWGFFQVINHGVAKDVLQKLKAAAEKFFELPLEEKKKYAIESNDIQGYGQSYVVSDDQKLDWSDALALIVYPNYFRKMRFWPTTPPDLIEAVEEYSREVNRVAKDLLAALSLLMGMEQDELFGLHKDVLQALRVNYYPTCCNPEAVLGPSNPAFWRLTAVKPMPDSLVVNIGDVLEVLSNGKYKSIEHRVVPNDEKARFSFASFVCPNPDVDIEPLDQVMDYQQHPRMYKKIKYGDYLRSTRAREHNGKSHTQTSQA